MARTGGSSKVSAASGHGSGLCDLYVEFAVSNDAFLEPDPAQASTGIASLIEAEVIPRLLLIHANESDQRPIEHLRPQRRCGPADVTSLTSIVLAASPQTSTQFIERLQREGATVEDLLLNLLAPVARQLGEMWVSDQADFLEVTSGVCQLQLLLQKLSPVECAPVGKNTPKALLLATPGEQHSLGLLIVAEMFRRQGWGVVMNVPAELTAIGKAVRKTAYDIVGFSLSSELLIGPLASAIGVVRADSRLAGTRVIVGGHAFNADPDLYLKVGADFQAVDAKDALEFAREVVAEARK